MSFQAMRLSENESMAVRREVKGVAIGGGVDVNLKLGSVGSFRAMV
jgi:hypothetical protein